MSMSTNDREMPLVDEGDLGFLRELTRKVIAACRTTVRIGGNDFPAYLASGSRQYPAFWTRDAVWVAASGLLGETEIEPMIEILAQTQNGSEVRRLQHGLEVSAWAIADHVLCEDGGAVFFPGTYSAGDDQGSGRYGMRAAQDACYMFVELAYHWYRQRGDTGLFEKAVAGVRLLERLEHAFRSPEHDAETELAFTRPETRAVAFSDAIVKTGYLLDGSILRWRAAMRLACILSAMGQEERSSDYRRVAERIAANLPGKLWHAAAAEEGWLLSASGIGRQACVRGTSFALALGILDREHARQASRALAAATAAPELDCVPTQGHVTYQGHVRHLRQGEYWQDTPMEKDTYQNGGYWGMFTGWFLRGVAITEPTLASATARVFVEHMRRYNGFDGLDAANRGAPWEWIHPDGSRVGPLYAPTITVAYRGFAHGFIVDAEPAISP